MVPISGWELPEKKQRFLDGVLDLRAASEGSAPQIGHYTDSSRVHFQSCEGFTGRTGVKMSICRPDRPTGDGRGTEGEVVLSTSHERRKRESNQTKASRPPSPGNRPKARKPTGRRRAPGHVRLVPLRAGCCPRSSGS